MVTERAQGFPVRLRAPHDLSFLDAFGRVFLVLDQMSSGMLGFGVTGSQGRLYLKYAGAATLNCPNDPRLAVERLRSPRPGMSPPPSRTHRACIQRGLRIGIPRRVPL